MYLGGYEAEEAAAEAFDMAVCREKYIIINQAEPRLLTSGVSWAESGGLGSRSALLTVFAFGQQGVQ